MATEEAVNKEAIAMEVMMTDPEAIEEEVVVLTEEETTDLMFHMVSAKTSTSQVIVILEIDASSSTRCKALVEEEVEAEETKEEDKDRKEAIKLAEEELVSQVTRFLQTLLLVNQYLFWSTILSSI